MLGLSVATDKSATFYLQEPLSFVGFPLGRSSFWIEVCWLALVVGFVLVVFAGITTPRKCGLVGLGGLGDDLRRSERLELT